MYTYSCFVFAVSTFECILLEVRNGNQAANITDMDAVGVRVVKETLFHHASGTVRDHTITMQQQNTSE